MSFLYMATPYSLFPGGLDAAYDAACEHMAPYVRAGLVVYSPVVHTHPIAKPAGIDPTDLRIWLPFHAPFMAASLGLIFAMLPSWQRSVGMAKERVEFEAAGKPVFSCAATGPTAYQFAAMQRLLNA